MSAKLMGVGKLDIFARDERKLICSADYLEVCGPAFCKPRGKPKMLRVDDCYYRYHFALLFWVLYSKGTLDFNLVEASSVWKGCQQ